LGYNSNYSCRSFLKPFLFLFLCFSIFVCFVVCLFFCFVVFLFFFVLLFCLSIIELPLASPFACSLFPFSCCLLPFARCGKARALFVFLLTKIKNALARGRPWPTQQQGKHRMLLATGQSCHRGQRKQTTTTKMRGGLGSRGPHSKSCKCKRSKVI